MKKYDTIIIGAGAAGLMCAMEAGRRGRKVLVLEHTANIAEKIRISGGGRCNFTNLNITPQNYISNNPHFAVSALKRYTQHDFINLVKKHGISFHEKTHKTHTPDSIRGPFEEIPHQVRDVQGDGSLGQLFCDISARQIIDMLLDECKAGDVTIKTNVKITGIQKGFTVTTADETYQSSSMVIACGGLSIPKIGATGFGYEIARQFGLNLIPTRAGLVPLVLSETMLAETKDLIGTSFNGNISSLKKSFSEGMIFTHRGLSGPAVLQVSSYWQPGEEVTLDMAGIDVLQKLKELKITHAKQELKTVLAYILPKKIAAFINGETQLKMADLSNAKLAGIASKISNWKFKPVGTEGYRTAEVTLGGVDTDELSSKTFEAKKIPGLFFIGEVVDVTGWLGGYNFQWAWSSGYAAGQYV